jgi:hypothetical protein
VGVVEASWLDEFLFGASRASLAGVHVPLLEMQQGDCFYCGHPVRRADSDVDHFIPWSRHPDNGLDNLVVADRRCNNSKRDSLAAHTHLEAWLRRFSPGTRHWHDLRSVGEATSWPSIPDRTMGSARAAYLWLPPGTPLWRDRTAYEPADSAAIRDLLARAA